MSQQTPLYDLHCQAGGKMVDFAGYDMPLHYGSQIKEHNCVRESVGMFDVSHMGVVDIQGNDAEAFLRYLLANDIAKLTDDGMALYSCLLNSSGGVIDDLICYRLGAQHYRLVINAATKAKDVAWLQQHQDDFDVAVVCKPELCILAVQGPKAIEIIQEVMPPFAAIAQAKPFRAIYLNNILVARTGYTGEDGVEITLPADKAIELWQQLIKTNVAPCGLGARDTLRLEAGLNLYGTDMDETTSPLVANLAWTVSWKDESRDFMGRAALIAEKEHGIKNKLVGLVMEQSGVLRNHQAVLSAGQQVGEITSGSFSPTLGHAIALARLPAVLPSEIYVERRGQQIPLQIVKPPFVRHGQKVYQLLEFSN
jgi:aminomethyltransferase